MSTSQRVTRSLSSMSSMSSTPSFPVTSEDREAANILLSLRSASRRDASACPSTACAACVCGRRSVTRSQIYEADEADEDEDYSDMPALIPIETPRFRLLAEGQQSQQSQPSQQSQRTERPEFRLVREVLTFATATATATTRARAPATPSLQMRSPRLAVLRAMSERTFEAFLARLNEAELETVRRASDLALASETNLRAEQRAALLEEIRERSSDDARAFTARRRKAPRMR